jgi:hypothetical protein
MREAKTRRRLLAGLVATLAIGPSAAWAGCVLSDVVRDEARVAVIRPDASRTHFVQDEVLVKGCPNEKPACQGRAFLVSGDTVLTGSTQGAYTCAGFIGTKGPPTIGWIPSAALAAAPEQAPADWTGHWVAPEQDITIASGAADALAIKGSATWGDSPARRLSGGVHTGEIAATVKPDQGVIAFAMGDDDRTLAYDKGDEFTCRVRMMRRGPYLVVRDNNNCGGANVSFSGFYHRQN